MQSTRDKRMDNTFGIFLKEKRQQKGLSLRALGKQVELSHIYLYNIHILVIVNFLKIS